MPFLPGVFGMMLTLNASKLMVSKLGVGVGWGIALWAMYGGFRSIRGLCGTIPIPG